jgi:ubiquinone/menaquinone biosynthesis C-methylase UbiE
MRQQQKIWQDEHTHSSMLPSLASDKAHDGVIDFVKVISSYSITPPRKAVDVGCGKGRNALYLAQQGFHAYGLDYIDKALEIAQSHAQEKKVASLTDWFLVDIGKAWPFLDNYFDIALDCFSSIDIEIKEDRETCRNELYRTLKPGGYALVTVVSSDDEFEKELIMQHPGQEKHSSIWPKTGKFQKNYAEAELRDFYSAFKIIDLKQITKPAVKLGKNFNATNFWVLLQKP